MPELISNNKFNSDPETFKHNKAIRKKIAKVINFLEQDPMHPGLNIERIVNDPTAWSARVDKKYRISFEAKQHPTGWPDWTKPIKLLRILDHDDLYKNPR